jgi:hypothetical protein
VSGLSDWLAARDITRAELEEKGATVERDVGYERLRHVDRLRAEAVSPGLFYFDGDELRIVFIPDEHTEGMSAAPLAEELGASEQQLRSRAGKNSRIELHAERGIAYSHDDDQLEFVEVFPPASAQWYVDEVYRDPGEFYK